MVDYYDNKIITCKNKFILEIINKRNDGYHDIESLMTFCNYGDVICVKRSKNFNFKINGHFSFFKKKKKI